MALLGDWARARGHVYETARVAEMTAWPGPHAYDAVISLGSGSSVHAEPHPWLASELRLLRTAHEHDVPILGICFGGQALAKALGGRVGRAPQAEVRWGTVDTAAPDLIMPGPWFLWHEDEFTAPDDVRLLAGTRRHTMAFASGRSLGIQFHPEVDAQLARAWIDGGRAKLAEHGIDVAAVQAQIERHSDRARDRAFEQFDRIEAWWSASSSLAGTLPAHEETR